MTTPPPNRIHPGVYEAQEQLKQGRISRREFLRLATLLGVSASSAYLLAACGQQPTATSAPPAAATQAPAAATQAPAPTAAPVSKIKRGGVLRVGTQVPAVDHPARFSWAFDAQEFRNVFEYLTLTDRDNITHPYLLEKWEASDDLKTWDLYLRKGIKWTNGDEFTADDVIFNFKEWLNPDVGSSILGLFQGFLTADNIEKVDDYLVRLHLAGPKLDVPENLFHYPAQIMHRSFNGDITSGKNPSTGPMALEEFKVGERVRVKAREGYWQNGEDGKPLPYLDAIEYIDLGNDQTAYVAALTAGQIDTIWEPTVDSFLAVRDNPKVRIDPVGTSRVRVLRFRVDLDPWTDNRVRLAVKKCQDRQKILDQAHFGEGLLAHDVHVSPVHPEFAPMDLPAYDPDGAKKLLEEAGQTGLAFKLSVGTGWTDVVAYAETLKEDAKAAGIDITLDTMPNSAYWDLWTETAVGITPWTHRPLAVMVLPLAYIADSDGKPVPWNESRWVDKEFTELLSQATGLLDVEARRAVMAKIQKIQNERGSIGTTYWQNSWGLFNPAFQNIRSHPTNYLLLNETWYDPDQDPFKK